MKIYVSCGSMHSQLVKEDKENEKDLEANGRDIISSDDGACGSAGGNDVSSGLL